MRSELVKLIHRVIDAQSATAAGAALTQPLAHPYGKGLSRQLTNLMDRLLVYQMDYCRGLQRVSPEWYWRDFRLRLSRRRNHRSEQRLEPGAVLWALYHNFKPAQWRSERKRYYRHPGQSALQVTGVPPGKSVTWMLWASDAHRTTTAAWTPSTSSAEQACSLESLNTLTNKSPDSPTQARTESKLDKNQLLSIVEEIRQTLTFQERALNIMNSLRSTQGVVTASRCIAWVAQQKKPLNNKKGFPLTMTLDYLEQLVI